MIKINIASDFTTMPWARYYTDWDHSGQEFYDTILKPKYEEAIERWLKLEINLDWTLWYASSFYSEAFWRLYFYKWNEEVWNNVIFISNDNKLLVDLIKESSKEYEED